MIPLDDPFKPAPAPPPALVPGGSRLRPVLVIAAVGVAVTLAVFLRVREDQFHRAEAEFIQRADLPAAELQREFEGHISVLEAISSYFYASAGVDPVQFRGFTAETLARLPALTAVEWIPRVTAARRLAHEGETRARTREAAPDYRLVEPGPGETLVPAAVRAEHLPIHYVEPASERLSLGLDLAADSNALAALARALDRGLPAAGPPFLRRAGTNQGWACRVFLPVYTNLVARESQEEREANVAGYAAVVLDLTRLAAGSMLALPSRERRGLVWELRDATRGPGDGTVLLQAPSWQQSRGAGPAFEALHGFEDLAGRRWELRVRPGPGYRGPRPGPEEWFVLGGGLLITGLLVAWLWVVRGRSEQVERLVAQRTAELADANQDLQEQMAQRQRTAAALAAERGLIQALLDTSPDHIYFKDRESRFIRINRSMAAKFGLSGPEAAVGRSDADFFAEEHAQRALEDERSVLRDGQPLIGREEKEVWPDGSTSWVSTTKQALRDSAGTIVGTFGVSRDISRRKQVEMNLTLQYGVARALADAETLAQAGPRLLAEVGGALDWPAGAIWLVDAEAGVLRCHAVWLAAGEPARGWEAATRGATFTRGAGLPGRVWASAQPEWVEEVTPAIDPARAPVVAAASLRRAFAFPLRSGSEVRGVVEFFMHAGGGPDESLLRMFAAVGSQVGQFLERRRAEQALARQAEALRRSNRDLEQFAYVASHDLQEPLRMVASYTQLLERRYKERLDDEAREYIGFAVDGARRMQTLINDLLAYARLETRARPFQRVEVEEALRRALANLKVAIEESQARVSAGPLPSVLGDLTQLTQLLQNLIGNALKFRGGKPAVVHVSARRATPEESAALPAASAAAWVVSVRDEGIGIEKQYFDRIFAIFQRLHTREEYPGTGIGLAVCQRIVERHGGRIWLESEPGQGTTFHFILPEAPPPAA